MSDFTKTSTPIQSSGIGNITIPDTTVVPSVVAYAGPAIQPDAPYVPTIPVPSVTLYGPCNHAEDFRRIEEHFARIEGLFGEIKQMLAVRQAMEEMLKKVGARKTSAKKKTPARKARKR